MRGLPSGKAPFRRCASRRGRIALAGTIALIGLPGSGKSAVAPLLAARLGCPWADLDDRIARAAGVAVPELLRCEGEVSFRAAEEAALRDALLEAGSSPRGDAERGAGSEAPASALRPGLVLACGGGAVVQEGCRALLRGHALVVWLRVAPETAAARLGAAGAAERPLLDGAGALHGRLAALLGRRAPLYQSASDLSVETDGRTPDAVAAEIQHAWEARSGPWDSSGS